MGDTLHVEPDALRSVATEELASANDLSGLGVGTPTLGPAANGMPGLQSGTASAEAAAALDCKSHRLCDDLTTFSTDLRTSADRYDTADHLLSQRITTSLAVPLR